MQDYQNPHKPNPIKSPAFKKYMLVSCALIFVIVGFVLIVWVAGGRQSGLPDEFDLIQLDEIQPDAPVVVFETNLGTLKAVLYPEETPEYYEYFTGLVNSGYYDGTYICSVQEGAYALGGTKFCDPDTESDESSDTTQIKSEVSDKLWPFKGSLMSYVGTSGIWPFTKNIAGSSIIFVNDISDAYMAPEALARSYGEELGAAFAELGGIPNFSSKYTIFGQIYDGWDTCEAIMSSEVLSSTQPASDIIFERVYMTTYSEAQAD